MGSTMGFRDSELEGSFSFSSYDFKSDDHRHDADSDDESYIEIALEQAPGDHEREVVDDDEDGEQSCRKLELRVSFSSSLLPFQELSANTSAASETLGPETESETVTTSSSSSSSSSTLSCSSGEDERRAPMATLPPAKTRKRKVQFRAVNRLLNTFLSSTTKALSEIGEKYGRPCDTLQVPATTDNHCQLVDSRKTPKMTSRGSNNIVMKLLIKFRSMNIRNLLASVVKAQQAFSSQGNGEERIQRNPFDKLLEQREARKSCSMRKSYGNGERSKVFEVNLDSIKGILESMSTRAKSCPSSTKSSPIHRGCPSDQAKMYATDNSIQAAIAHCKSSLGQSSDFHL